MAKWTTACFGLYWPSSDCLKRTGLGSYCIHCARTRGVEISTQRFLLLFTKVKLYVEVCSAGVWLCSCLEACSPSFTLIRLRRGGLSGLGCLVAALTVVAATHLNLHPPRGKTGQNVNKLTPGTRDQPLKATQATLHRVRASNVYSKILSQFS